MLFRCAAAVILLASRLSLAGPVPTVCFEAPAATVISCSIANHQAFAIGCLGFPGKPNEADRRRHVSRLGLRRTTSMAQSSATVLPETPIDATVRLMTPERIVFDYPLGGPFRRFTAYLVDLCLLSLLVVAAIVVSLSLSLGASSGLGPALIAFFLLTWGYGAFCEGVFNGQTPGKRAWA